MKQTPGLFYRKHCKNCIYWLHGFGYVSERIGRCPLIGNSGASKHSLQKLVDSGEDRFAFVDLPRDEPVYTSDEFGCVRFIPNNKHGRKLLLEYEYIYRRDL